MKDEMKKKIKKGALIALQVTLGGFALLGMISTGALVKSCSKGEINTTAVVATTPVVGQRVKKLQTSDIPSDITWNDLKGTTWANSRSSVTLSTSIFNAITETTTDYTQYAYYLGLPVVSGSQINQYGADVCTMAFTKRRMSNTQKATYFGSFTTDSHYPGMNAPTYYTTGIISSYSPNLTYAVGNYPTESYSDPKNFTFGTGNLANITYSRSDGIISAYEFATWAISQGYTTSYVPPVTGAPITYDYAYCAPVGTLPGVVPLDYTSVTLQFQADSGYGFPDTGEEIPGYTQIYSEGLVIDSYTYGGYLGNGMYNAIEIQCSRDSDPPAESCHISVSALATSGFEYPEWKTLRVLGTHCTIYMADDHFDSDGVVHLQAYPDTGYYFDQDRAFIGNQLKEYYGAEVIMYDLSTGGLYLTIRKNTENLVLNESPYIEITPLAGSVPVGGSDMGQAFDLLRDGFSALLPLFMIQVLPGITLGMLFMVPFIVILILFILKVVHK